MIISESNLRKAIRVVLEQEGENPKPKYSQSGSEDLGLVTLVPPEDIASKAPSILRMMINDRSLMGMKYNPVQVAAAEQEARKHQIYEYIDKWSKSLSSAYEYNKFYKDESKDKSLRQDAFKKAKQSMNEYRTARDVLITKLSKQRILSQIVLLMIMPEEMAADIAAKSTAARDTVGASFVQTIRSAIKNVSKITKKILRAGVLSAVSIVQFTDYTVRDLDATGKIDKLVKETFSYEIGKGSGTFVHYKVNLAKGAMKVRYGSKAS